MIYASLEPFGAERDYHIAGIIASTLCKLNWSSKNSEDPPGAEAFMPKTLFMGKDRENISRSVSRVLSSMQARSSAKKGGGKRKKGGSKQKGVPELKPAAEP